MTKRTILAPANGHQAGGPPAAQRLQDALAKIVTDAELEDLVRQLLKEAKEGTVAEKKHARTLLLGLLGAKNAAPTPQYIQQNFYRGDAQRKKAHAVRSLVVRYLETEGPCGPELIAAEIARPVADVVRELENHPELFVRGREGWAIKKAAGRRSAATGD